MEPNEQYAAMYQAKLKAVRGRRQRRNPALRQALTAVPVTKNEEILQEEVRRLQLKLDEAKALALTEHAWENNYFSDGPNEMGRA